MGALLPSPVPNITMKITNVDKGPLRYTSSLLFATSIYYPKYYLLN